MFKKIFSKATGEDLILELRKKTFNESKADSIVEHVNINSVDNDGKSFLHHMCSENRTEQIRWLIKQGIDKELQDYYDETALTLTLKNDSFDSFKFSQNRKPSSLSENCFTRILYFWRNVDSPNETNLMGCFSMLLYDRFSVVARFKPVENDSCQHLLIFSSRRNSL